MDRIQQFVESHIPQMDTPEKVYGLFKELGFDILNISYHGVDAWGLREKDKESVDEIYSIADYEKKFQIFLVVLKSSAATIIRELPPYFEREIQHPFFVFTTDFQHYTFVLIEKIREDVGVWKRKLIKLNIDRQNLYHTDKLVISNMSLKEAKQDASSIYRHLQTAMSVQRVSDLFFDEYKKSFFQIRKELLIQNVDIKQAHGYAQQLLNRIMFIYFIDKKRWLKNSPGFMKWFWAQYREQKKRNTSNEFYRKWLRVLFHEAFNNRFSHPKYMPQEVLDALTMAPYLNGGLFKENELDDLSIDLTDNFMEEVLDFFNKYNFTIREDLPLDVEVAVDPQMIGYVYESLANVAEEIYERQDLGIFYTPRIEVDFMCRRSLLEYISKNTGMKRDSLYHLLFDDDPGKIEKSLNENDFITLEDALDNLAVIDPACGSGAFLVGMLNVLVNMYKLIYKHLRREMTDYQLKKRIVGRILYGVDVMPWAVHSAELRLWLSLMIESDLTIGELKIYPLLPNLNLRLRVGDSLVQELGGVNLNLRDISLSQGLKRKLSELKDEKEKYFNNEPTAKFKTEGAILAEEQRLFRQIINERGIDLAKKKQALTGERGTQFEIFKRGHDQKEILDEKALKEAIAKEQKKIENEIAGLGSILARIQDKKPFVWDIDFAEIFGEKAGFDIVIGNPPYVRQEKIAPPGRLRNEITNEEKREYKEKLLRSVQTQLPQVVKIDKKSDLYVYFYFHGLSLLNEKGTFCFITSNSWLDVGYGRNLQEFLLKYVPIIAIYDNQAKRSFAHADVNTIIALFAAPERDWKTPQTSLSNLAKFIMFKRPYDEVINTENLLQIENANAVLASDDFRVYPKKQTDLLEEGWEYLESQQIITSPSSTVIASPERNRRAKQSQLQGHSELVSESRSLFKDKFLTGSYNGNKWGGKYLKAPDIYFTLINKSGIFVPLSSIAEIRYGLKTGVTEFFYIDNQKQREWNIENDFLMPLVTSTRELTNYILNPRKTKLKLFVCGDTKANLKKHGKMNALKYIEWGEKQTTKKGAGHTKAGIVFSEVPSVKGNDPWYSIKDRKSGDFAMPALVRERYFFLANPHSVLVSNMFYQGNAKDSVDKIVILAGLNSTVTYFFQELLGRPNIGGRLNFYGLEFNHLFVPNPTLLIKNQAALRRSYDEYALTNIDVISSELEKPERQLLDDVVRTSLGISSKLWAEMSETLLDLIFKRTEKEKSLLKRRYGDNLI